MYEPTTVMTKYLTSIGSRHRRLTQSSFRGLGRSPSSFFSSAVSPPQKLECLSENSLPKGTRRREMPNECGWVSLKNPAACPTKLNRISGLQSGARSSLWVRGTCGGMYAKWRDMKYQEPKAHLRCIHPWSSIRIRLGFR